MTALEICGIVTSYLAALTVGAAIGFGKSYLAQKAQNLAQMEDTRELTRVVEEVRAEYAGILEQVSQQNRLLLEQGKRRHDLRLAALDRRLETHQKAYVLWVGMFRHVHEQDPHKKATFLSECQEWLVNNRLYLEPTVADAFTAAFGATGVHSDILQARMPVVEITRNWAKIEALGDAIVKAAQLPPLNDGETKVLGAEVVADPPVKS